MLRVQFSYLLILLSDDMYTGTSGSVTRFTHYKIMNLTRTFSSIYFGYFVAIQCLCPTCLREEQTAV